MNAQTVMEEPTRNTTSTPAVPAELTSAQSKLVYLYLDCGGSATVDDIADSLGLKKITLYPILDSLVSRGFVATEGNRYATAA